MKLDVNYQGRVKTCTPVPHLGVGFALEHAAGNVIPTNPITMGVPVNICGTTLYFDFTLIDQQINNDLGRKKSKWVGCRVGTTFEGDDELLRSVGGVRRYQRLCRYPSEKSGPALSH